MKSKYQPQRFCGWYFIKVDLPAVEKILIEAFAGFGCVGSASEH